jgi:hypothetical protein
MAIESYQVMDIVSEYCRNEEFLADMRLIILAQNYGLNPTELEKANKSDENNPAAIQEKVDEIAQNHDNWNTEKIISELFVLKSMIYNHKKAQ